jgi:TonB family protein
MFKDRQFNKAFLISLSWHLFLLFFVTIVVLPANFKLAKTSAVSFLGPLLEKSAFEIMVEQQPQSRRTSFAQPFYSDGAAAIGLKREGAGLRFDKVFGLAPKAREPQTTELFGNSKIVPIFKQAQQTREDAAPADSKDFYIKGPLEGREIIFRPAYPTVPRRVEGQMQDVFGVELKFTVAPDGAVTDASLLASSGYPDIDLAAINYVKAFKFLPQGQTGAGEGQTGAIRLNLKSR